MKEDLLAMKAQVESWGFVSDTNWFFQLQRDIETEEDVKIFAFLNAATQPIKEG